MGDEGPTTRHGVHLRQMRDLLLALYLILVLGLWVLALHTTPAVAVTVLAIYAAAQVMLVAVPAHMTLDRPLPRGAAWAPATAAGAMFALLVGGAGLALSELLYLDDDPFELILLGLVVLSWIVWTVVLTRQARRRSAYATVRRHAGWLAAGSLAELLIACSAHMVVSRRPQCLAGLATMMGIVAGMCVLVVALGPAIALLYLRDRYLATRTDPCCTQCGYDLRGTPGPTCPECGTTVPRPPHR